MRIGSYDVTRVLGRGGMGETLLARARNGRVVVLKRPHPAVAGFAERLRDEGRVGLRLFHPHLVETLDLFDDEQGQPVLVVGYIDGENLDVIRQQGALPAAAAARIGWQVSEALSALHGALDDDHRPLQAIHRDVGGKNIVVDTTGRTVLIDLGIAKDSGVRQAAATATGTVIGTLRYLSPEVVSGAAHSTASDLWALGCVVFEAATGAPAYDGPLAQQAAAILLRTPLDNPAAARLLPELRAALVPLLTPDPARRTQHAHEAAAAFRAVETALGAEDDGGVAQTAGPSLPVDVGLGAGLVIGATPGPEAFASTLGAEAAMPAPLPPPPVLWPDPALAAPPPAPAAPPPPRQHVQPALQASAQPSPPQPIAPQPSPAEPRPAQPPAPRPEPRADPRFAPPPVRPADLELDRQPPAALLAGPARESFYPNTRKSFPWARLFTGVGLVAVLVISAVVWRLQKSEDQRQVRLQAELDTEEQRSQEVVCTDGAFYVYEDKNGTSVVVDSIFKVPPAQRKRARCANAVAPGGREPADDKPRVR